MRALVALDRDHPARRRPASSARVSPPGPGPDLDHGHAVERTGGARDAAGEIEIEQEILAERLLGGEAVAADHLAQRRQIVVAAIMRAPRPAPDACACVGGREPRRELQRRDEARRIGLAGAGDVEGGAVIGRGAHERQAERDVDGVVEGQRLDRDQRLVVIHAERGVVGLARRLVEHGVGGQRPARIDAVGDQPLDRRLHDRSRPPCRACRLRRRAD